MRGSKVFVFVFLLLMSSVSVTASSIELELLGRLESGVFDDGAAEIVSYDSSNQRVFIVNSGAATIDVLDITDPSTPVLATTIDVTPFGAAANSVSARGGVVAVAVEAAVKQDPGKAVFFSADGSLLNAVTVGALPDMITFTPDGKWVLVANEGEPSDDYLVDPEGSVSVIDVSGGVGDVTQGDVRTADFQIFNYLLPWLDPSIRIFGPGATPAQDFEPEFIAVESGSEFAWVTLQENNAIAILDIERARIFWVVGLGFKDHSRARNALDASNRDSGINISTWPVRGMYQPDSLTVYNPFYGIPFLVTANEGDSRDYSGFSEEARIGDLSLDPTAFPDAATLQLDENLGRLKITTTLGDSDDDGDFDRLFSYGARSFSIRTVTGRLIFDSGDQFERITAAQLPADFNSTDNENGSFDDRSDDKGPEPEGVVVGRVDGRHYAFIGLERIGGIMVYDITNPFHPFFVQYLNTRDFSGDPILGTAGDLAPEGLLFIDGENSPNDQPLLVVGYEVSGTAVIFQINSSP